MSAFWRQGQRWAMVKENAWPTTFTMWPFKENTCQSWSKKSKTIRTKISIKTSSSSFLQGKLWKFGPRKIEFSLYCHKNIWRKLIPKFYKISNNSNTSDIRITYYFIGKKNATCFLSGKWTGKRWAVKKGGDGDVIHFENHICNDL